MMSLTTSRLLAIDPGLCTGVCLVNNLPDTPTFTTAELDFAASCRFIKSVIDDGDVTLVAERFTISERTIKLGRDHTAIELIGVMKWFSIDAGLPEPIFAGPAEVKRLVTDARLKQFTWHRGGGGHANDASRHAVYHLLRLNAVKLPDQ
jgi:hypothetical protein